MFDRNIVLGKLNLLERICLDHYLLTDPSKLGLPLILKCILKVVLCHEEVKSYFDFVSVSHVTVSNNEQMFVVCLKSELFS